MSKALSSWFGFSLCILGYFCANNNPALAEARLALEKETLSEGVYHMRSGILSDKGISFRTPSLLAQVTSDDTVNTQVTENGNTAEITGGETKGDNLFHSFQDFSVGAGNEAAFLNANDIANIFSRVTGGNISNIDGLISANGSANLFLINPAGIIFGEGARLDIGGSFYGSSASSILFEDGEFSATDLENPPLLTVNAPIGLGFRDDPQPIANQSVADGVGLQVDAGKSINLVGGDLNFVGGILTVPAGNVQLGGLSTSGTVGITNKGNLSFPDEVSRGNVSLTQGAFIDVAGTRGGEIELRAADIQITGGSVLQGGTFADVGLADSQSGNINLNATGAIDVNGSRIDNLVGMGNAGAIEINATSFSLINDGTVINSTFGQGNAGDITINATEDVSLDTGDIFSNVGSRSVSQAEGNAGEIAIDANSISLTNGAQIQSTVFEGGLGNGNNVTLNARGGDVTISSSNSNQGRSGIFTDVETIDNFAAGNIKIDAQGSILLNNAVIRNANAGSGFAGDINLNAPNEVSIKDSTIEANGNSGRIFIGNTIEPSQVTLEGQRTEIETQEGANFAFSNTLSTASSNPDDLLERISINAGDRINITGTDIQSSAATTRLDRDSTDPEQLNNNFSVIALNVDGENPLGNINIERSRINTSNSSTGFAGDINLNALNEISIKDSELFAEGNLGRIAIGNTVEPSQVTLEGQRTEIENGTNFTFSNTLSTDNFNSDDLLGGISINARDRINIIGSNIDSETQSTRTTNIDGQDRQNFSRIFLTVDEENPLGNISIERSRINTSNSSTGFAGDINLNALNEISIKDSQLFAEGNLGRIAIGDMVEPSQVTLEGQRTEIEDGTNFTFSNTLSTDNSNSDDLLGGISINARDRINIIGSNIDSETQSTRTTNIDGQDRQNFSRIFLTVDEENPLGNINIERSQIDTTNFSTGFAGDINLNARAEIEIVDTSIFSTGQLGRISIGKSDISGATSSPQTINFNDSFVTVSNENEDATVAEDQQLNAGSISINAINNISVINNSEIRTLTERLGDAGNLTVQSENGNVSFDNSDVFSNVEAGDDGEDVGIGSAGDINITANFILFLNGSQLQSSTFGIGDGGNIILNAQENITLSGKSRSNNFPNNFPSAIFTNSNALGNAGNIQVNVTDGSLSLNDEATLNTESDGLGDAGESDAGEISINADIVSLDGNSSISAQAFGDADGGNLTINSNFIVAFPNQDNNIIANAQGNGGEITINAESVFGIEERPLNDFTNDINASSEFALDGTVNINTSDINPVQGATELPSNVVEPEQATAQTCEAGRGTAQNSFAIAGKGGVPPAPDAPLNSENIIVSAQSPAASTIPQPIETSQGKIQPARGIKVTESGKIVLTAYRTNSAGERIPEIKPNCNSY